MCTMDLITKNWIRAEAILLALFTMPLAICYSLRRSHSHWRSLNETTLNEMIWLLCQSVTMLTVYCTIWFHLGQCKYTYSIYCDTNENKQRTINIALWNKMKTYWRHSSSSNNCGSKQTSPTKIESCCASKQIRWTYMCAMAALKVDKLNGLWIKCERSWWYLICARPQHKKLYMHTHTQQRRDWDCPEHQVTYTLHTSTARSVWYG